MSDFDSVKKVLFSDDLGSDTKRDPAHPSIMVKYNENRKKRKRIAEKVYELEEKKDF
jgi:hypothetical protein